MANSDARSSASLLSLGSIFFNLDNDNSIREPNYFLHLLLNQ